METKDHRERWIIEVRKCVTTANPKITVGSVLAIFSAGSPQMDLLHKEYEKFGKPQEAFDALIAKYGQKVIGL